MDGARVAIGASEGSVSSLSARAPVYTRGPTVLDSGGRLQASGD
jgi:hypothetical protein